LNLDARLLISAVVFALFVLVGNPIIVFIILRLLRHHERTAFYAGLTMAQISEFSFIIANRGLEQGFIDQALVSMIAVVGLITMVISTYMITYNEKIYRWLAPLLRWLPLPKSDADIADVIPVDLKGHIVIFGYHETVDPLLDQLKTAGEPVIVVDYNPENTDLIKHKGVYYVYGDMREDDILKLANLSSAKMIISIVPYHEATMSLLQYIEHFKLTCKVIVTANFIMDVEQYYAAGATYVLHPESITLHYLAEELEHGRFPTAQSV
ncbi:MAG: NAD-binding protein, partial [Candidatus Kerfeldbacteria bacterium]|nr:NAD-binding protein [Candidatus Kerfeldbacteria bacterium]